jgi:hypothetical protein
MIRALETNACEVLRRTAKAFSSNRFSSLNVKGVNLRPAIRASAFSFAGRIGPRPSTTAHATSGFCFVSGVLAKGGTGKPTRYGHSRAVRVGGCVRGRRLRLAWSGSFYQAPIAIKKVTQIAPVQRMTTGTAKLLCLFIFASPKAVVFRVK